MMNIETKTGSPASNSNMNVKTGVSGESFGDDCAASGDFKSMLENSGNVNSGIINFTENSILVSGSVFKYDSFDISRDDAMFFAQLASGDACQFALCVQGEYNASLINMGNEQGQALGAKSVSVTKNLNEMLENAMKTQKPVRFDFDNNVSVILKVDKEGKLNAEFIPGDKAVEQYLRDNIGFLKQRFDEQGLAYNDIFYRKNKENQRNKDDKKENKGE